MSYINPSLVEIYSDISLKENISDESIFFEIVPKLKDKGFTTIEINHVDKIMNTEKGKALETIPKVMCWNKEKTKLIQLSNDLIVFNQVGNYLGWDNFKELYKDNLELIKDYSKSSYSSISLNTIDVFKIEKDKYLLNDYFDCEGGVIPLWYKGSTEAIDIKLGKGLLNVDNFNKSTYLKVRINKEFAEIHLHTKLQNIISNGRDNSVIDELEKLHDESNDVFESIITDKTRSELLGGTSK